MDLHERLTLLFGASELKSEMWGEILRMVEFLEEEDFTDQAVRDQVVMSLSQPQEAMEVLTQEFRGEKRKRAQKMVLTINALAVKYWDMAI